MGRVMFLTVAAGPEGGGSRKSTIKMPKKVLFPDCDRLLRVFCLFWRAFVFFQFVFCLTIWRAGYWAASTCVCLKGLP